MTTLAEIKARHDLSTVNGVGNAMADYLEEFGHCQTGSYAGDRKPGADEPSGCVIYAWDAINGRANVQAHEALFDVIRDRHISLAKWSDNTPTPEVIATLRSLGAEEAK